MRTDPTFTDILPARYLQPWRDPFHAEIGRRLRAGMTILDIGGGRRPALPLAERPEKTIYIGLDADGTEFEAASAGAYDRTFVADAATPIPELEGSVDLAVSWQVFEHVQRLEGVLTNTRDYLKPRGSLVSMFSGRWSVFAVLNRLLPNWLGAPIASRVHRRKALNAPVFPAYYNSCSYTALRRLTTEWTNVEIFPFYHGATYFSFAPPLMRAYLVYENAIRRMQWRDGASHYLLVATR